MLDAPQARRALFFEKPTPDKLCRPPDKLCRREVPELRSVINLVREESIFADLATVPVRRACRLDDPEGP